MGKMTMCQTPQEIEGSDIVVKEINDYLNDNNLASMDRLILRVMKHNRISNVQIQQDLGPISKHAKLCGDNPSLSYRFKYETGKVLLEWLGILGFSYVMFRMLEILLGLDEIVKALIP